jgi:hypothetical protein
MGFDMMSYELRLMLALRGIGLSLNLVPMTAESSCMVPKRDGIVLRDLISRYGVF